MYIPWSQVRPTKDPKRRIYNWDCGRSKEEKFSSHNAAAAKGVLKKRRLEEEEVHVGVGVGVCVGVGVDDFYEGP